MFGDQNNRDHVAWDIETTGFAWDAEITVSGYWWPAGHADPLVNTNGESIDTDACERHLRDVSGGVPVTSLRLRGSSTPSDASHPLPQIQATLQPPHRVQRRGLEGWL